MKILIKALIFFIILFFYLHIQYHLKINDDLEIYDIDQPSSKQKMEEICDLRQPTILNQSNNIIIQTTNVSSIVENYSAFDVKLHTIHSSTNNDTTSFLSMPLHSALKIIQEDQTASLLTEKNTEFILETTILKTFMRNDFEYRPPFVSNCYYDIIFGSNQSHTPFRYELNYRNYFMVTKGSVTVKLAPPKSTRYLFLKNDYENFEFCSPVNPWNVQPEYKDEFSKVKCMECTLSVGKTLFIPSYWWYSIQLTEDSSVSVLKYRTYMNNVTISPYLLRQFLQQQNIRLNISSLSTTNNVPE